MSACVGDNVIINAILTQISYRDQIAVCIVYQMDIPGTYNQSFRVCAL